jgi:hypothetical protein
MSVLLDTERAALEQFCTAVRARFGDRLRELALFGSRARGEGGEDSSSERMGELRARERLIAREIARDAVAL